MSSALATTLVVSSLLLAGCDGAERQVPAADPAPPVADDVVGAPRSAPAIARIDPVIPTFEPGELVFEYSSHSHFGGSDGWRIFADGRYESIPHAGPEHERDAREPQWEPLRTLTELELKAFLALMYSYDLASLEAEYEPAQRVMDGTSGHWTLRLAEGTKHVVVRDGIQVQALEDIWAALPPGVVATEGQE